MMSTITKYLMMVPNGYTIEADSVVSAVLLSNCSCIQKNAIINAVLECATV